MEWKLSQLPPHFTPTKQTLSGGGLCLNNKSRDGEMTLFGDPSTEKVSLSDISEFVKIKEDG